MYKSFAINALYKTKNIRFPISRQSQFRQPAGLSFFSSRGFSTVFPNYLKLPVLDTLVEKALTMSSDLPLKNTAVVYVHHPLQTSVNLVQSIIRLGVSPENFFAVGKHYSECEAVVKQITDLGIQYQRCTSQIGLGKFSHSFTRDINWLWSNVVTNLKEKKQIEKIIVLDHGGHALAYLPPELLSKKIVGIEKTTGGLFNLDRQGLPPFPIIGVANCAAKKVLESPLIAEAVVNKLLPLIPIKDANLTCGVVGYGAIGKAVANKLLSMGHKVIVYDSDPNQLSSLKDRKNVVVTNTLPALVSVADFIFGCTGRDIAASSLDHFRLATKDKTLISCSSEDVEFLSLLQLVQHRENGKVAVRPLNDVIYKSDMGAVIRILRGGFPINFDNTGESVPANDIQLTRALVLGGILQASCFYKDAKLLNNGGLYALDASLQSFIANEWLKYQPLNRFSQSTIDNFHNKQWISESSGGVSVPNALLQDVFEQQSEHSLWRPM